MVGMNSLSDQLKALGVQLGAEHIPSPSPKSPSLDLADHLPGTWEDSRFGRVFVVTKTYPSTYHQGKFSLGPTHPLHPIGLWADVDSLDTVPLDDFLFLDTETTGLSGGTGTYTFLTGIGRFQGPEFVVQQFFMQDPAEEAAQLAALETALASARVIVSYNGKSFDLPRLKTRYRAHGWPPPLEEVYHLDLLHLVRRLFGSMLNNCTLGTIEYQLLEFERSEEDIPGWQVAESFFEYLNTGDPSPLTQVFYHNAMDVVSMAAILNLLSAKLASAEEHQASCPGELVSLGKFFLHLGKKNTAQEILQAALQHEDLGKKHRLEGIKELSFLFKRQEEWDRAVQLWEAAAEEQEFYAFLELAKVHEHHYGSFTEALHWTLSAIELHQSNQTSGWVQGAALDELQHRLSRLKDKARRSQ